MKKAILAIDSVEQTFEGYVEPRDWNGWACPWFTKEVGFEIMKANNKVCPDYPMAYNAKTDAFYYYSDPDFEPEEYKGCDVNGEHLYPIGNCSWIWYETKEGLMKKTYYVTIEEIVSQTFEVEADDIGEAMEIAESKYYDGEFVLEPGEVTYKQMSADDHNGDCTEWTQF